MSSGTAGIVKGRYCSVGREDVHDARPRNSSMGDLAIHDERGDMKWHQLGDVVNGRPDPEQ
jgi:hypothetical protein